MNNRERQDRERNESITRRSDEDDESDNDSYNKELESLAKRWVDQISRMWSFFVNYHLKVTHASPHAPVCKCALAWDRSEVKKDKTSQKILAIFDLALAMHWPMTSTSRLSLFLVWSQTGLQLFRPAYCSSLPTFFSFISIPLRTHGQILVIVDFQHAKTSFEDLSQRVFLNMNPQVSWDCPAKRLNPDTCYLMTCISPPHHIMWFVWRPKGQKLLILKPYLGYLTLSTRYQLCGQCFYINILQAASVKDLRLNMSSLSPAQWSFMQWSSKISLFWFSLFRDKFVKCLAKLFVFSVTLEEIFRSRIKPTRRCEFYVLCKWYKGINFDR